MIRNHWETSGLALNFNSESNKNKPKIPELPEWSPGRFEGEDSPSDSVNEETKSDTMSRSSTEKFTSIKNLFKSIKFLNKNSSNIVQFMSIEEYKSLKNNLIWLSKKGKENILSIYNNLWVN